MMEGNINTKESFTDTYASTSVSQNFYNITQNTQTNASLPSNYNDFYETERLIYVFTLPVITLMGSAGNMLTFFAMRRGSLKDVSTCFYMAILALTDTSKCSVWID